MCIERELEGCTPRGELVYRSDGGVCDVPQGGVD